MRERRGGVLVRVGDAYAFVPATVALRIAAVPQIARLAGAAPEILGIALFEGVIIPVITLGGGRMTAMVVCTCGGEPLGLVGLDVVGTGVFQADPAVADGIVVDDRGVPPLDLPGIFARLQGTRWAGQRPS